MGSEHCRVHTRANAAGPGDQRHGCTPRVRLASDTRNQRHTGRDCRHLAAAVCVSKHNLSTVVEARSSGGGFDGAVVLGRGQLDRRHPRRGISCRLACFDNCVVALAGQPPGEHRPQAIAAAGGDRPTPANRHSHRDPSRSARRSCHRTSTHRAIFA